jgi:hypothetical protein
MRTGALVAVCAALVFTLVPGIGVLGAEAPADRPATTIGFGFPTFGKLGYDDSGNVEKMTGFNLGLGYSARYFTADDGMQPGRFNFYWGWGTVILLLPYVEFGWTYPFPLDDGKQYLNLTIGFLYIVPHIELSICF